MSPNDETPPRRQPAARPAAHRLFDRRAWDIDVDRRTIVVREGKGAKDRGVNGAQGAHAFDRSHPRARLSWQRLRGSPQAGLTTDPRGAGRGPSGRPMVLSPGQWPARPPQAREPEAAPAATPCFPATPNCTAAAASAS